MEPFDILIVDGSKTDREAIKRHLANPSRARDLRIHEAETGADARQKLDANNYKCVFLEYRLPDMDGITLLKMFYDAETYVARCPIVMITGQGNEAVMMDALRWGAQDYILKQHMSQDALEIAITKVQELFDIKVSRKNAQDQLHNMRRMEAVGKLTSGIAHDFNNLLTVTLGNTYLLGKYIEEEKEKIDPEYILKKVRSIETVSKNGADLIRRLMIYTRQRRLKQEEVNLNACIRETFVILKRTLSENIVSELALADELWPVNVDAAEFSSALINMAINARDAMLGGGKLIIETSNVVLDATYVRRHAGVTPGLYVMTVISDTGHGMSHETIQHIFEPFFTTKPIGEGTGLGLSMVYGFIKQSGGHITVYSEEGAGTVFKIYLPKIRSGTEENAEEDDSRLPSGQETVLIAENDSDIRGVTVALLERLGYRVLEAESGRVALELLRLEGNKINLLFTDIFMSGDMNGVDLVKQVRSFNPDMRVLYTSGYSKIALSERDKYINGEFIGKPYRNKALATKIREILDRARE